MIGHPWQNPRGYVLHDYLYAKGPRHGIDRKGADQILLDALAVLGFSWWRRQAIYWAVRVGGGPAWANHRARDGRP